MLSNAKVGTKLLALIVAPVMVLLAVASIGAHDRLDDAARDEQVEATATLTAASDSLARALAEERLLTTEFVTTGSPGLEAAHEATDDAVAALRPMLSVSGDADRSAQVDERLTSIEELRESVDNGDASAEVVIDGYVLAVDELLGLNADLAAATSAAELSIALADASVLARAQEVRSVLAAEGVIAIAAETFAEGDLQRYTDLAEEERRLLDRYVDGASAEDATRLRDALATPAVVAADRQVEELISDATIGGPGEPQIGVAEWIDGQLGWAEVVGGVQSDLVASIGGSAGDQAFDAERSARLFMLVTAIATLLSILLAVWVARSIDRPLRRLTKAADDLATDRLPRLVENLRSPDAAEGDVEELEPIEVVSGDEIGQVTEAFNAIQQVAANVAEEQSTLLRKGIGDIFVNLARRNQSLLDRQIEFIDELESKEQDPDLLENLFRLDHLATRMRRNAESLLVLAGAEPARRRAKPVSLADVVRVAIGEVEDFTRVELRDVDEAIVAGNLAVDLSHLMSELMENATHFSPPETMVEVGGQFGPDGSYVLAVADHGIGMSAEQLAEANQLLANPPLVGLALGRSLGFTVVGRIAVRLGVRVHLNASPAGGVTAVITMAPDLVARPGEPEPRDPLLDRAATQTAAPEPTSSMLAPPAASSAPPPSSAEPTPIERPKVAPAADPSVIAGTGEAPEVVPEGEPAPLPTRSEPAPSDPADHLSEALPEGDRFEEGLASLMGPETSDEDVEHQFWGSLADEDEARSEARPAADTSPPGVPDEPPAVRDDVGTVPEPPSMAAPSGLTRRVPGAGSGPAPVAGPSVDAPRRSPEEVRAMLSRYRDGRKGRSDQNDTADDGSTPEDR